MSKIVEPKVYFISKSAPNMDAISEWLSDLGVQYEPDNKAYLENFYKNASPGAINTRLAGQRCYLSFVPLLNANVTRVRDDITAYISNILDSGHGCYDGETEVLTRQGWVNWGEVNEESCFATLNKEGMIEYHKPKNIIKSYYEGRMYQVQSEQIDLFVTPNHNMFICGTTTREGRKKDFSNYQLVSADKVNDTSAAYLKTIPFKPIVNTNSREFYEGKLYGFALGDGCRSSHKIKFHLRKKRKIDYLKSITKFLGFAVIEKPEQELLKVIIPSQSDYLLDLYNENKQKRMSRKVMGFNTDFLAGVMDGLKNSDGAVNEQGYVSYYTASQELADNVQELALFLGYSTNICCYDEREKTLGHSPIFRLNISDKRIKPIINKHAKSLAYSQWIDNWSGMIYCAEVPNNTLYVRRNGKPVWCGNSILEHTTYTFAIENVSRVLTAELNRHRAGIGVSEGSGRYIRYDEIPYFLPFVIREKSFDMYIKDNPLSDYEAWQDLEEKKRETREVFAKAFTQMEENYKKCCDIWGIDNIAKFYDKKVLTSMFRRLVGMGATTGGVWTGNLRALRHIFTVRCSRHAEEEICYVASMMLQRMMIEEPQIFGDFKKIDGYYQPEYHKV